MLVPRLSRMLQSAAPSSLAPRATATRSQRAVASPRGGGGGAVASPCRLHADSLCSSVSRSRSRGSGWRPWGGSSLSPWPQRTMLVRFNTWYGAANVFQCTSDGINHRLMVNWILPHSLFPHLQYRWSQPDKGEMSRTPFSWVCLGPNRLITSFPILPVRIERSTTQQDSSSPLTINSTLTLCTGYSLCGHCVTLWRSSCPEIIAFATMTTEESILVWSTMNTLEPNVVFIKNRVCRFSPTISHFFL